MRRFIALNSLLLVFLLGTEHSAFAIPTELEGHDMPAVIHAQALPTDPWYPYITRPTKEYAEKHHLYPDEILNKIPKLTFKHSDLVPWTFKPELIGNDQLFSLNNVVPDKIIDKTTKKTYNIMYHGTSSDLLDVFKQGASAIRFDVATNTLLGMGFYLAANMNEAKAYACQRALERHTQAMLVVVGIEDDPMIKGKFSRHEQLSDKKTGNPLYSNIFFNRNSHDNNALENRYNQFAFFSNIRPYLKIFYIILLPNGFGKSHWFQDEDGKPAGSKDLDSPAYHCKY